jgi:hypothetical protein
MQDLVTIVLEHWTKIVGGLRHDTSLRTSRQLGERRERGLFIRLDALANGLRALAHRDRISLRLHADTFL